VNPLTINCLIPEPFPGAGGDTGIFRIIRLLAEFGHHCRVYVVAYNLMNDYSPEQIREYIRKHFGPTNAQYHRFTGTIDDADCTFATFWPTVENLLTLPNGGRRYYLVQDFEPSFYPDEPHHYERAENTYRVGLHCITLGPWLTKLLREKYHARAEHFDFAVDTNIYWPRAGLRGDRRRVCFYARPVTPRRAYALGVAALQLVKSRLPEVEIEFFGSSELAPLPSYPFTNRGLLAQDDLAKLFSSADVGVVFSLTNPSFVPLEMMACRCAVLEMASERWNGVLTHGQDAWLVEPTPEAVANGIVQLLENKSLRESMVENAWQKTRTMSWEKSVRQIENILVRENQ
jgi:O-antigen biosynthesis protein